MGSRATARRVFVAAIALLVVNDWLLKGEGALPCWLTGKLSDAAGMLVAPVVLVALLSFAVPLRAARVAAVAAIGLVFAALKLDAAFATAFDEAVNAATRALGLPLAAHTAVDPTDLVTVPLLAVGDRIAARLADDRPTRRSGALLAGLLACAATSPSQFRLDAHWGPADPRFGRQWATRFDGGAVVLELGRQSSDGAFEMTLELAAKERSVSLDTKAVTLVVPDERVAAEAPAEALLRVGPDESAGVTLVFRPHRASWPAGTLGGLEIPVQSERGVVVVRAPFSFEERTVSRDEWHTWTWARKRSALP